jgi:hypothetical protein
MASAFQQSAFQRTGYQIAPAVQPQLIGWGAIIGRRRDLKKKPKPKCYVLSADAGAFTMDAPEAAFSLIRMEDLIAMDNDFLLFGD